MSLRNARCARKADWFGLRDYVRVEVKLEIRPASPRSPTPRASAAEHWVSARWAARRDSRLGRNGPKIAVGPNEVTLVWEFR